MNTDNKHTPGQWEIVGNDTGLIQVKDGNDYKNVALCCYGSEEEAEANAKLIASAPELLEAVKMAQAYYETTFNGKDGSGYLDIGMIEAAINKAIGQ